MERGRDKVRTNREQPTVNNFKQKADTLHTFPLSTLLSIDDFYELFQE